MRYLSEHPEIIQINLNLFQEEMRDLQATRPAILAFGKDAYNILSNHLKNTEYSRLIRITHYSHQISKEAYKETVFREIASTLC